MVPDCNVGFLAWLNGSDFVLEEQLASRPCSVRTQSSVNVDCFRCPKGMSAIHGLERLAFHRSPYPESSWIRSHKIVGSTCPLDSSREPSLERLQALRAFGTVIPRVCVPNPPQEGWLRFRIASVILLLQRCHHIHGVFSRNVAVNDAVA